MKPPQPPELVAIMAMTRSGSTLLDMLLADAVGGFSGGELRHLWQRAVLEQARCACGARPLECDVWSAVLTPDVLGDHIQSVARRAQQVQADHLRLRRLPRLKRLVHDELPEDLTWYVELVDRVHARIREVTGTTTIIDSSKLPTDALLMASCSRHRTALVHLVRDPAAVAHSWSIPKAEHDGRTSTMPTRHAATVALQWAGMHRAIASVSRGQDVATIQYEDLTTDAALALGQLLLSTGLRRADAPGVLHAIGGNPARFAGVPERVVTDRRHEQDQPRWSRALVRMLTTGAGRPRRSP